MHALIGLFFNPTKHNNKNELAHTILQTVHKYNECTIIKGMLS